MEPLAIKYAKRLLAFGSSFPFAVLNKCFYITTIEEIVNHDINFLNLMFPLKNKSKILLIILNKFETITATDASATNWGPIFNNTSTCTSIIFFELRSFGDHICDSLIRLL